MINNKLLKNIKIKKGKCFCENALRELNLWVLNFIF